jgi:hypothetical protein
MNPEDMKLCYAIRFWLTYYTMYKNALENLFYDYGYSDRKFCILIL